MMSKARSRMFLIALLFSLLVTVAVHAAPAFASEPLFRANTPADMDLSVDPGVDFYRYANGGWLDKATIPADFPAWDTMTMLDGQTRLQLVQLLETAADSPSLQSQSDTWKAVRLFQQGVDLETRN